MESDEIGNDLVRLDNGYLVDEENNIRCEYVVHSDDVLGKHIQGLYLRTIRTRNNLDSVNIRCTLKTGRWLTKNYPNYVPSY